MTIGTGILVAAILALVTWQIDKHKKWRAVIRIANWCFLGVCLVGIGAWCWTYYQDIQQERKLDAEKSQALSGMLKSYVGVSLGVSKDEVRYKKGAPDFEKSRGRVWIFDADSVGIKGKVIWFGKSGKVCQIICKGDETWHCPRLAGVEIGDSESNVTAMLGKPVHEPEINEKGELLLRYGGSPKDWYVGVILQKEKVTGLVLNREKFDQ